MIEIHAHILHGVDDGPKTIEGSLALLEQAIKNGITDIIATPHYHLPSHDNKRLNQKFDELKTAVVTKKMPIKLHLGNEVYADEHTFEHLNNGSICTLAKSKYVLLELPFTKLYPFHQQLMFYLQQKNYRIVLAHIERYDYLSADNYNLLKQLIRKGCYAQINAEFILKKQKKAKQLIENGYVHFVSSDMHNIETRACQMAEVKKVLDKLVGPDLTEQLTSKNARMILEDNTLNRIIPEDLKQGWLSNLIG